MSGSLYLTGRFQLDTGAEDCVVKIEASPSEVKSVFLIPPNDDNYILPEQEYELMFLRVLMGGNRPGRKPRPVFHSISRLLPGHCYGSVT